MVNTPRMHKFMQRSNETTGGQQRGANFQSMASPLKHPLSFCESNASDLKHESLRKQVRQTNRHFPETTRNSERHPQRLLNVGVTVGELDGNAVILD